MREITCIRMGRDMDIRISCGVLDMVGRLCDSKHLSEASTYVE